MESIFPLLAVIAFCAVAIYILLPVFREWSPKTWPHQLQIWVLTCAAALPSHASAANS